MRDPAPPKLKPVGLLDADDMLRVEPCLAASRRSLTAVSWASNLEKTMWLVACYVQFPSDTYLWFAAVNFS